MKKLTALFLLCALLMTAFCLPVQAKDIKKTVTVGTVDELLAAIAPDTAVTLAPGTYALCEAASYGKSGGKYWRWEECYDGYELVITNVEDFSLTAAEGAEILAAPRYANVLSLYNCEDVLFSGLTVGHSPEKGACMGGVVQLTDCSEISLEGCVLFGCGVTGLIADDSETVSLNNCTVKECSDSGAVLCNCENVLFNNCVFSDNGDTEYAGYVGVCVSGCRYVTLMNSSFTGNRLSYMLQASGSSEVAMLGCETSGNEFCFFYLEATDVTVSGCSFKDLVPGSVFAAADNPGRVLDSNGTELTYDTLLLMKHSYASTRPARVKKTSAAATVTGGTNQHYYEVSTADEFLAAIGSHRVICLKCNIDLNDAYTYGTGYTDCWYWEGLNEGAQLVITGVKDLTITAKAAGASLLAESREANVLTFKNCNDISVTGLSIGHTEKTLYTCSGAVLVFNDCKEIEIEDCALSGCGTIGVEAYDCEELDIEDTEIYDCTVGGIYLYNVNEADIENCSIHDCEFPALFIDENCKDIEVNDKKYKAGEYREI